MANTEREAIYDEKISPLMAQIIAICKEHKIPVVASFDISDEDHEGFKCTTYCGVPASEMPEAFKECYRALYRRPEVFAFTITTGSAKP